ncbi:MULTISPECIES: CHAT domain-containing protein [unclassified Nonomuraea]|uniref:CHAT domain-containing protein n=1 Tax=unclassified Nonomuraea TaxID=2593643 RepID=UPI0033C0CF86
MVGSQAELAAAEFRAAALKARGRGLLEAVRTLAWFHWSRFRALPSAEGESDLFAAIALFDVLADLALVIAPEELHPVLHAANPVRPPLGPESRDTYSARLREALGELDRPEARDRVAALLRRVESAQLVPGDPESVARARLRMDQALIDWDDRREDPAALDAVIEAARTAERLSAGEDRLHALEVLSETLNMRFGHTEDVAHLHETISAQRRLLGLTGAGDPRHGERTARLAERLIQRHKATGQADDLAEAIELCRALLERAPADDPGRLSAAFSLTVALRLSHVRTGVPAELDEAIESGRLAARLAGESSGALPGILASLGVALRHRFQATGRAEDLEEAIEAGRRSVRLGQGPPADEAVFRNNLGLALQTRFSHGGDLADLDEAIEMGRRAAEAVRGRPGGGIFFGNLSTSLRLRFQATSRGEDLTDAMEAAHTAVELTPPGHADLPVVMAGLESVRWALLENDRDVPATGSYRAARPAFPGPFWALSEDVRRGDLDLWQAEAAAPALLTVATGNGAGDGAKLEELAVSAGERARTGEFNAPLILLRLVLAAIEGAPAAAAERLAKSRAVVSHRFVGVAALVLTLGADPELYHRALAAGEWALSWARAADDESFVRDLLLALALLHQLPYTNGRGRETYGIDHERWLRRRADKAARPGDVLPTINLLDGEASTVKEPEMTMPAPGDALRAAEAYAREALASATSSTASTAEADRRRASDSLAEALRWLAALGEEVDAAELSGLAAPGEDADTAGPSGPATPAHVDGPTDARLARVVDEIVRLAGRADVAGFVGQLSPELAILALHMAIRRGTIDDPDAVLRLKWLHEELTDEHGDERDREDHADLDLHLLRDLYLRHAAELPALREGYALDEIPGLIRRLGAGRSATRRARAALLVLLANRLADVPAAARHGLDAVEKASQLDPGLQDDHGWGLWLVEARLHFTLGAGALYGEEHIGEGVREIAEALVRFAVLRLPSRVGDCLSLLKGHIGELDMQPAYDVLAALSTLSVAFPRLEREMGRMVQLIFGKMVHTLLSEKGVTPEFLNLLLQLAKGWRTHMALSATPPLVAALDESAVGMLAGITPAEEAALTPPGSTFGAAFIDAETVLVSWSDAMERRPSSGPADRLRNRQRRFDRRLVTLMTAQMPEPEVDPLSLEEVQRRLGSRTVLLTYYCGFWNDEDSGVVYLLVTDDDHGIEIRVDEAPPGDLWLQVGELSVMSSPRGVLISELRRRIQDDPLTDLVDPMAAELLEGQVEALLGRLRPRLDELRAGGRDRLVIVPHGPLHYFPFHLLGPAGRPLADDWTVTYLPNLGLLRERPGGPPPARTSTIASFGLTYHGDASRPPLPRAAGEAAAVASRFGATATPEHAATKTAVLRALRESRYVHISAHGSHNVDAPAFQSILLAGIGDEGVLHAHELLRHDLRGLDLITLSACETALGRFDRQDDLQGLPAAFLLAGARTVVGTLWEVSDQAAELFFPALYDALAAGADVFDAFRDAQQATRTALPQYWDWGAFYLIGGVAR